MRKRLCPVSPDELRRLYGENSLVSLCSMFRTGETVVRRWLTESSIPIRNASQAMENHWRVYGDSRYNPYFLDPDNPHRLIKKSPD